MTRIKSSYLRWKISQPGYYKQRALQMAEQCGDWTAEEQIAFKQDIVRDVNARAEWLRSSKFAIRYHKKMCWCIDRI